MAPFNVRAILNAPEMEEIESRMHRVFEKLAATEETNRCTMSRMKRSIEASIKAEDSVLRQDLYQHIRMIAWARARPSFDLIAAKDSEDGIAWIVYNGRKENVDVAKYGDIIEI